jgi:hypothetical protein
MANVKGRSFSEILKSVMKFAWDHKEAALPFVKAAISTFAA